MRISDWSSDVCSSDLLADVQEVVTIGPRSHARIATPISFAGDGKTIALIDMHCGKLSHALGKFDDAISCRGEYFLAPIDQHVQVDVDVINETDAIVLIRPGTRIGILTFININNETTDPTLLPNEYALFPEFNPIHAKPTNT